MDSIIVQDGDKRYIVNPETGEILHEQHKQEIWIQDDEKAYKKKLGPHKKTSYFFALYRSNWIDLVIKRQLSFAEIGVFASLIAFIDWQSNLLVDPKKKTLLNESSLANLLKCDKGSLRNQITKLSEKGLIAIVKSGKGSSNKYILNSHITFYGRKIRDIQEHYIFSDVNYIPKVPIDYKQITSTD